MSSSGSVCEQNSIRYFTPQIALGLDSQHVTAHCSLLLNMRAEITVQASLNYTRQSRAIFYPAIDSRLFYIKQLCHAQKNSIMSTLHEAVGQKSTSKHIQTYSSQKIIHKPTINQR
jgi:hypothetical protein